MEALSLSDGPSGGAPGAQPTPPTSMSGPPPQAQTPQLPPQMFTTAAQLLDLTDKKLMISLRDGRRLLGVLRSWDQFANLVLQDTVERIFVDKFYADIPRGVFIVRGENVLLLGEIDLDRDDYVPAPFEQATAEKVLALQKAEENGRHRRDNHRLERLKGEGFEGENMGEVLL